MPRPIIVQRLGESHLRYKDGTDAVIADAPTEQIRAILQQMVVPEFLEERDESNTVSVRITITNCFVIEHLKGGRLTLIQFFLHSPLCSGRW